MKTWGAGDSRPWNNMDKADDSVSFVSLAQVIFLDYSFTLLDDIKLWLRGRSGLGRLSSLAGRRVGKNGSVALRHIVIEIKDGRSLLLIRSR